MTIDITRNATFGVGQVISFREQTGFYVDGGPNHQDPSFTNEGTINVTSTLDHLQVNGVWTEDDAYLRHSAFHNSATGTLSVTATGMSATAIGYNAVFASLVNDGLIDVSAPRGFAIGMENFSDFSDDIGDATNNGTIRATGESAVACFLYGGGELINTADIEAHGAFGAVGVFAFQNTTAVETPDRLSQHRTTTEASPSTCWALARAPLSTIPVSFRAIMRSPMPWTPRMVSRPCPSPTRER